MKNYIQTPLMVCIGLQALGQDLDYIRLIDGKFMDGPNQFRMNIVNYSFVGGFDPNTGDSYCSPNFNYSSEWDNVLNRRGFRSATLDARQGAENKLIRDLDSMQAFGFNTIRLYGFDVSFDSLGNLTTLSVENHNLTDEERFELLEEFLALCEVRNLRVIWVPGKPNLLTDNGKNLISGYSLKEYRE